MVTFEIGNKLYTCPECNLFVFPTEESAVAGTVATAYYADWLSKELNCHVSILPAGQVFCCVETGGEVDGFRQVHVVSGEATLGWINVADWLNIKEMVA